MIELKDSATRPGVNPSAAFRLDEDKYAGFVSAVDNGQTRLALEYAVHLMTDLNNEVFHLREDLETLKAAKKAPAKKTTKKAATKASVPLVEEDVEQEDAD